MAKRFSTLCLVVAILAIVGTVVFGVLYVQQQSRQASLKSQIATTQQALGEYDSTALDEEKAAAEASLATEQAYFPSELDSATTLGSIFQLADQHQIAITSIAMIPEGNQNAGNHIYTPLSISLRATGTISKLEAFIEDLESGSLQAVALEDISLTGLEGTPVMSVNFSIYARSENVESEES